MKTSCFLTFAAMACATLSSVFANDGQPNTVITNTMLHASDIPGLNIEKSDSTFWWHGKDEDSPWPLENSAMEQEATLNGIQFRITYSEFRSSELATQGLNYQKDKVATAVFDEGIWNGATPQTIGDVSWHYDNWLHNDENGSVGLLLVANTTCLLMSCDDGNEAVQKSTCEQVAVKIVEKIRQGCHVIVSDENPPPQYKPAP